MTPFESAAIVEFGEARAYADLYRAPDPAQARQFGIGLRRLGPAWLYTAAAIDIPLLNRVVGLGVGEPATETQVDDVLAHFDVVGVRNFTIQLSPAAQPAALPEWLAARGLAASSNWVKMIRAREAPAGVATRLKVELVDAGRASTFGDVASAGFGMPPALGAWLAAGVGRSGWRHYLALDSGRPVGAGALFISERVGWLGIGATLPEARGQGAQGAIMVQRIRDAIAYGCDWIVTETGEETPGEPNPSYHNMLRTGFQLAYPRPNYVLGRPSG
jgi:hypothetical protein